MPKRLNEIKRKEKKIKVRDKDITEQERIICALVLFSISPNPPPQIVGEAYSTIKRALGLQNLHL